MRTLLVILSAMLILIQYPLWLGKGGWLRVWDLERQLVQQRSVNGRLSARNEALAAEVADLRDGSRAIEERARYDLGMVKPGEVFVQINEAPVLPRSSGELRTASAQLQ
ncbi:MAG TPA: cell division protein FtsB [Burkholderiaceae bacterium]|nr:cell division protein FtsB [Burkholderiaceae bacterium]